MTWESFGFGIYFGSVLFLSLKIDLPYPQKYWQTAIFALLITTWPVQLINRFIFGIGRRR